MTSRTFPPETIEEGALSQVDELLNLLDARRVFIVADEGAYKFSGASQALESCLNGRQVSFFSEFELNPKINDVERGIDLFHQARPAAVIALGGGSSLDMGKLIATCGMQDGPPVDYIEGKRELSNKPPPLIAIPTTSGTGSEVTHFAVVYIEGKKISFAHPYLIPKYVFIDPKLTYSLPPNVTAASGLDAMCQCIESISAVGATDESIGYARQGLQLAWNHLASAVNDPTPAARMAMAKAAHFSGQAINISKTTAPHAFSYAVTTRQKVPHGAAVALTLGAFLRFNYEITDADCIDPRGAESVKARIDQVLEILGNGSMDTAQERLQSLLKNIGCPIRLQDAGIGADDLPPLIDEVNVERLSNNPRSINASQLALLLRDLAPA